MKSRAVVIVGVVASVLLGLLGLFVGIMNTFTHWCGEDCGSDASRIAFGLVQVVAALLLLAGAYLAARLKPNARWVWIAWVSSVTSALDVTAVFGAATTMLVTPARTDRSGTPSNISTE